MKTGQIIKIGLLWSLLVSSVLGIKSQTSVNSEGNDQIIIKLKNKAASDTAPLVVNLNSNNKFWNKIKNSSGNEVSLNILVEQPTEEWSGFRVFFNLPKVDAATSIKRPEYIGSAAFYGNTVGGEVIFTFELKQIKFLSKAKQFRSDYPTVLSIVPIRSTPTKTPKSVLIIRQITINSSLK